VRVSRSAPKSFPSPGPRRRLEWSPGTHDANSDLPYTYDSLLAEPYPSIERKEFSCSAVLLYLGVNRTYPRLLHHNLAVSRDLEATCRELFVDLTNLRRHIVTRKVVTRADFTARHGTLRGESLLALSRAQPDRILPPAHPPRAIPQPVFRGAEHPPRLRAPDGADLRRLRG
jgi:hypothetical protein